MGQLFALAAAEEGQTPLVLAPLRPLQRSRVAGRVVGSSPSLICILAGMDLKDTYAVGFGGFWNYFTRGSSSWLFPYSAICLVRHWVLAVWTLHSVSSGKHSGTFVSTAPVAEPTVMSFTVPLDDCTIIVTVVTSYSSSADCCGPFVLRECLRRDVVWWWLLLVVLTILCGTL